MPAICIIIDMPFKGDPSGRLLLPVVLAAYVLYGFDANVVNVAIPDLQRRLGAGPAALELVVGGYVFTYAAGGRHRRAAR